MVNHDDLVNCIKLQWLFWNFPPSNQTRPKFPWKICGTQNLAVCSCSSFPTDCTFRFHVVVLFGVKKLQQSAICFSTWPWPCNFSIEIYPQTKSLPLKIDDWKTFSFPFVIPKLVRCLLAVSFRVPGIFWCRSRQRAMNRAGVLPAGWENPKGIRAPKCPGQSG